MLKLIKISLLVLFTTACTTAGEQISNKSKSDKEEYTLISWPVSSLKKVSRGFNRKHHGIDIVGKHGSRILAAHSGYVIYAGEGYSGYGKMVILDSTKGWSTLYAHLSKINVKQKMFISRGDLIGRMGDTGVVTGTHLHFELMYNKNVLDPKRYLPFYKSTYSSR